MIACQEHDPKPHKKKKKLWRELKDIRTMAAPGNFFQDGH